MQGHIGQNNRYHNACINDNDDDNESIALPCLAEIEISIESNRIESNLHRIDTIADLQSPSWMMIINADWLDSSNAKCFALRCVAYAIIHTCIGSPNFDTCVWRVACVCLFFHLWCVCMVHKRSFGNRWQYLLPRLIAFYTVMDYSSYGFML